MAEMIDLGGGLSLREFVLEDAPAVYEAIVSDRKRLGRWLPFVDFVVENGLSAVEAYAAAAVKSAEMGSRKIFSLFQDDVFAGLIGLYDVDWDNGKAEIGYWIHGRFEKQGIVSRSARCLLERSFENLGLNRIQIRTAVENEAGRKVALRLGFTLEGIERDSERFSDGRFVDAHVFSLLAREWRAQIQKDAAGFPGKSKENA